MGRRRRGVVGWAVAFLGLGMARTEAEAGDFAVIGIAQSRPISVEARELLGEWKDAGWRQVVWRIEPGDKPGGLRLTHTHRDGSVERLRGVLVHVPGKDDFLDLTPANSPATRGEQKGPHAILKLKMARVSAISVGTPRRVRQEFGNRPGKSYYTLTVISPREMGLRALSGAPEVVPASLPKRDDAAVKISATTAQVAAFLKAHGADSSLWKGEADGTTLARRIVGETD
jgi:hypothetical protein